ncbi:MAG: hypothetical protein JRN67_04075 [Nitrososphaerota archaeon]|nr:hypothetical protein [Nitrososphaerota archaeon]
MASELLSKDPVKGIKHEKMSPLSFRAHDLDELIQLFGDEVVTLREVLAYSPSGQELVTIYDLLRAIREASLEIFNNLQKILCKEEPKNILIMEGFIPSNSTNEFEQIFGPQIVSLRPLDQKESRDPRTPSLVVNPRIVSIFENIALQRGIPKYNEIDPTPVVAFVFPFFFGMMFGDVGHGVTLVILGWYLAFRTKFLYWGKLLVILGSSTLAVGFVRGTFFGLNFNTPIHEIVSLPKFFSAGFTLEYIPLILEIAIIIGTFHLASAYVISLVNDILSRDYIEAFLDRLATLLLYASIIPFGLAVAGCGLNFGILFTSSANAPFFSELLGLKVPVSTLARDSVPFIIGSLILLIISHPLGAYRSTHKFRDAIKALAEGLLDGAAKPFEFFTNVLSYVRLGVLLVTTTVLSSLISSVLSFGIPGVFLAVFLNIMMMAMEGLIVYIQDMRLQLYEWLSKFYVGTGIPFSPMVSRREFSEVNYIENVHATTIPVSVNLN